MLNIELILAIATAFAGLVTSAIAFLAIIQAFHFRTEASTPEKLANIPDYLNKQYVDRDYETSFKGEKKHSVTLREARLFVVKDLIPKSNETTLDARKRFVAKTFKIGTWQNQFAYEVSLGLEWVGAMILAGAIPLSLVLSQDSLLIIKDWTYCKDFVEKLVRAAVPTVPKKNKFPTFIRYQRRHAEWLVYAAGIYLSNNWKNPQFDDLFSIIGPLELIKIKEQFLRKLELQSIPSSMRKEINKILGKCSSNKKLFLRLSRLNQRIL